MKVMPGNWGLGRGQETRRGFTATVLFAAVLSLAISAPMAGCKSFGGKDTPPPAAENAQPAGTDTATPEVSAEQPVQAAAGEPQQPATEVPPVQAEAPLQDMPEAPPPPINDNPLIDQPVQTPTPDPGDYADFIEEDVFEAEYTKQKAGAPAPPPAPQTVQLRRKGKTYDILMNINPGDENVYVQMDIPDEEKLDITTGEAREPESPFNRANKSLHRAQQLFFKKQYKLSLSEVNKALVLAPDFAYAHALKGSVLYKLKKMDLAVQSWQTALQYDPTMDDVRKKLEELGY